MFREPMVFLIDGVMGSRKWPKIDGFHWGCNGSLFCGVKWEPTKKQIGTHFIEFIAWISWRKYW